MERVNGNTPQDFNKLNTNFLKIAKKLFNKFTFNDLDSDLKEKVRTSFITLSDVGQFDVDVPHTYHFYIAPKGDITKRATISLLNGYYKLYQENLEDGTVVASGDTTSNGSGNIMTGTGGATEGHRHDVSISSHSHDVDVVVPNHKHGIVGKVAISDVLSNDVVVKLNGNVIAGLNRTDKTQVNQIDISKNIIKGWNAITCTSSSLARITIYGTIELEKSN